MSTPTTSKSKTILVTGASKGIGHATAISLLENPDNHKVILVARTKEPLEELKKKYPGRVEFFEADLGDLSTCTSIATRALSLHPRINSLILNHSTLHPISPIASTTPSDWLSTHTTNFLSCITLIIPLLPTLRSSSGTILLLTSGASLTPYSACGPYGSSKACINHLAATLGTEEKEILTLAVRPGNVDTDMMREVRENAWKMEEKDRRKFWGAWEEGRLLNKEVPARVLARVAVSEKGERGEGFSGRYLNWDDEELRKICEG